MSLVPSDQTIVGNLTVTGTVTSLLSQASTDPFGDIRVCQRRSMIDIKSSFGLSTIRDVAATSGTGTVTGTVGQPEYVIRVDAANDSAQLQSNERGRYIAGYGAEIGIAVRLGSSTFTGSQIARWGYFDALNGFFFYYNATGFGVGYLQDGVETRIPSTSFNVDKLDGTGPSGMTLSVTKGQIYQIVYCWYGYGSIDWRVVLTDADGRQLVQSIHRYAPNGSTSVLTPNLPICVSVNNGATTGTQIVYVAGRQYSVIGNFPAPARRLVSPYRINAALAARSVWFPIISVRRKAGFNAVPIKVSALDVITASDMIIQLRLGATLTGSVFGNIPETSVNETCLEMDTSSTTGTDGTALYTSMIGATNKSSLNDTGDMDLILGDSQVITLFAMAYNANSATVSVVMRLTEEW